MKHSRIRILIADDHTFVREGLKGIINENSDMMVTEEASHGQETMDIIRKGNLDVVVLPQESMATVFIADDSHLIRKRLINVLSDLEKIDVVGEAESGAEAIKAIRELNPDVVILDVCMSPGSGLDVLRSVKGDKSAPIVIMYTNHPFPQFRKKCIECGADFFFDKTHESGSCFSLWRISVRVSTCWVSIRNRTMKASTELRNRNRPKRPDILVQSCGIELLSKCFAAWRSIFSEWLHSNLAAPHHSPKLA